MMKWKREHILPLALAAVLAFSLAGNLYQAGKNQELRQISKEGHDLGVKLVNTEYQIVWDGILLQQSIYESYAWRLKAMADDPEQLQEMKGFINGIDLYHVRHVFLLVNDMIYYQDEDLYTLMGRFYKLDQKLWDCLSDLSQEQRTELIPYYEALVTLLADSSNQTMDDSLLELVQSEQFDLPRYGGIIREINGHLDTIEEILDQAQV